MIIQVIVPQTNNPDVILNLMPGLHFIPKKVFKGQTYIDLLIGIAVLSILGLTLFRLSSLGYELISYSRARIAAKHLAQEKLEEIRNLTYGDAGTAGGIPSGTIGQYENIKRNGINYLVETKIVYVDDPFDNEAPIDTDPADYKRVRVKVSWGGLASSSRNPIELTTDISSGISTEVIGGVLKVLVFDASGNPLPQAVVKITSSTIIPAVDLTQETDSHGVVSIPGATECVACYRISASKAGYSSERTYSITEIANPFKQDQGVFKNQITQISFAIDKVASLTVSSVNGREASYSLSPGVNFKLRGGKVIGNDAYAQPVYKFDKSYTTDAGGLTTISNLEWDVYQIYMEPTSSYDIGGTNPLLPLNILPDSENNMVFVVYPHSPHSLLTITKDPALNRIESAYVKLFDSLGFDQTKTTGLVSDPDFGQAFFSSLEEKTYQMEATASGFLKYTGEVIVSEYTKDEVVLQPE